MPEPEKLDTVPFPVIISPVSNPDTSMVKDAVTGTDVRVVGEDSIVLSVARGTNDMTSSLQLAPLMVPWLPLPLKSMAVVPDPLSKRQYPTRLSSSAGCSARYILSWISS